ncbi:unnamed protein product [Clonostachys byssicola]|uniref:F-box domain-containing protein n=1 Tax=Clonostachys byssicola TaxID=160290 RepID=A0A9N9XXL6_9HYPO|nr:unnamed protein product [Clonostachys byssicola]
MEHTFPLQSLPLEVQCFIIQFLDPIALISLSQTGRFYRQLIRPGRTEQIERLLALECLAKYGGERPILHPDVDQAVAGPDWHRDAWPEHHRWACAACLRLLPHSHFDNHSLLRRRNRKPLPDSPEATPLTSWQPGTGQNARRWHQQRQAAGAGARNNPPRDSQQLGWARARRKCNECKFQRGEFLHTWLEWEYKFPRGTPAVPIQTSRRLAFNSVLDRFFTGLEGSLESGPRPFPLRRNTSTGESVGEQTWTMYMMRCPGCERWQEQRAFRIGGQSNRWRPMAQGEGLLRYALLSSDPDIQLVLDEMRCNHCFVREHGRDALGKTLLRFLGRVIEQLSLEARQQLEQGWCTTVHNHIPKPYVKQVREMLERYWRGDYEMRRGLLCMTYSHAATLRVLYEEFKTMWTMMRTHPDFVEEKFLEDTDFMAWLNCYHEPEAIYFWLREVEREVERNPDMLVAWALGRDGASLA